MPEPLKIVPADRNGQPLPADHPDPGWCMLLSGQVTLTDPRVTRDGVVVTGAGVDTGGKPTTFPAVIPHSATDALTAARRAVELGVPVPVTATATRVTDADQAVPYADVPNSQHWLRIDTVGPLPAPPVDPKVASRLIDVEQAWAMQVDHNECDQAADAALAAGATVEQINAAAESGRQTWTDAHQPASAEPDPAADPEQPTPAAEPPARQAGDDPANQRKVETVHLPPEQPMPAVNLTRPTEPAQPDPAAVDALVDAAGGYQDRPVHLAVMAVRAGIGAITKGKRNEKQNYWFRGIDDVLNVLKPALDRVGVLILPLTEQLVELEPRRTSAGGTLNAVRVLVRYEAVGPKGDALTVATVWGEGADAADKGTGKAYSMAMKTAMIEAFAIPTEDLSDGDTDTPEGAPAPRQDQQLVDQIRRGSRLLGIDPQIDYANRHQGHSIESASDADLGDYLADLIARHAAMQAQAQTTQYAGVTNGQRQQAPV